MNSPDVIVIGAGVAGLRAAVDLSARGARVRVLEAKAVLGGRASSFNDPQTGERVDNGQHVLVGCYHETFKFLATIGTADRVRLQPNLDVEFVDRAGERSRLRCPSLPAPINLLAGLLDWTALGWADRLSALRMAGVPPASPFETVEQWLINNGQTARLREMLWEPLALAALNQSVREAAAPPFARVLSDMFGGDARDAALGLPLVPLDQLFAEPARRFVEARGGDMRIGSPAKVVLEAGSVAGIDARGERMRAGAVICAVPWHALPDLFVGDTAPIDTVLRAAAATQASPIASVNLWLDRRSAADAVSRAAGPIDAMGVRQTAAVRRDVAFDDGVQRRRSRDGVAERGADAGGAARAARGAAGEPIGARAARDGGPRAARDVFSGAGPAAAAGVPDRGRGPVPGGGLDRHGPARYDRRRRHQRPDGGRGHFMNSVVVHYQEIALKGRNRPWFIARLVRNLRNATSDLDVRQVVPRMGRIEIVLGSAEAWAGSPIACATRSASRIFRARGARRSRWTRSPKPS